MPTMSSDDPNATGLPELVVEDVPLPKSQMLFDISAVRNPGVHSAMFLVKVTKEASCQAAEIVRLATMIGLGSGWP